MFLNKRKDIHFSMSYSTFDPLENSNPEKYLAPKCSANCSNSSCVNLPRFRRCENADCE